MMELIEGKVYRFESEGLFYSSSGNPYISLIVSNDEKCCVKAMSYQEDWEVPSFIECFVVQKDPLILKQSRAFLLRDRYPNRKELHPFSLKGKYIDENTRKEYYKLKDEFDFYHRYYPNNGEIIEGDSINLWVYGVSQGKDGEAHLLLSYSEPDLQDKSSDISYIDDSGNSEIPGGEGYKVEFKSSLVYPAGTATPDIDKQTKIIMQSIAGMMNADGGSLYLGVNDDGNIRSGIEDDFEYLNSSQYDIRQYKLDSDGYQNKLYSAVKDYLGGYAKTLVDVDIKHSNTPGEHVPRYAIISVKPSIELPIWVKGKSLFVRTGNNTTHLYGDEITHFIRRRFSSPSQTELVYENEPEPTELEKEFPSIETSSAKLSQKIIAAKATFDLFDNEKRWGYLYFFKGMDKNLNAVLIRDNQKQLLDYEYRVPLPKDYEKYDLVICYENGFSDWINLRSALFTEKGKAKTSVSFSWKSGRAIVNAFCVKNNQKIRDYVAYVSTKNGRPFIKCNVLTSLTSGNPHQSLDNKGNAMLESGSELKYAMRVSGDRESRVLLEGIGLVYDDRINHKNGKDILSLPKKTRDILSEIIDLFICSVKVDDSSSLTPEVITVPVATSKEIVSPNDSNELPPLFDTAWVYQKEGKSFFVKGKAFAQMNEMLNESLSHWMHNSISIWELEPNKPIYVFRFRNNGLVSNDYYTQIYSTVVAAQLDYLNTKDSSLHKRLNQKEIAEAVGCDDSSVSRALDSFSVVTSAGYFEKNELVAASGKGDLSETTCIRLIKDIRDRNPNFSDQEITDEINRLTGANLARRTVSNYRNKANIPNSRGKI